MLIPLNHPSFPTVAVLVDQLMATETYEFGEGMEMMQSEQK